MKFKIACLISLVFAGLMLAGCCTTEERINGVVDSVHNIALDGDGIN